MSLVVFTGGARSGKSAAAQGLAELRTLDGASVVAMVFALVGEDLEMAQRVESHQAARPECFGVMEVQDSAAAVKGLGSGSILLLDCLGTLVGMVMAEEWPSVQEGHELVDAGSDLPDGYAKAVEERVDELVAALIARRDDTIVVTNEVGDGVVPPYASGRLFRDVLGRANKALVARADLAYLTVCGRLIELGSLAASPIWPED
jgi:adenosylcobinamide kinase/adenosylcobinamide-phosphate guanylyltransferase